MSVHMWDWEDSEEVMSNSFTVRFCFNPFLPLKSKNSQHPEISASAGVSNSSGYDFLFVTVFSCLLWHFVSPGYLRHQVTRHQIDFRKVGKLPQWRARRCFVWRPSVVLKVVHGDMAPNVSDVWSFLMVYWEPYAAFLSLSAGGWVALRWVHQGGLLQPWKIWGELKWCLSISDVTLLYCFIRHYAEKNKFQYWYCKKKTILCCVKGTSWLLLCS